MSNKDTALQHLLSKAVDYKKIFGTSFAIQHNDFTWVGASGDLSVDTPYFIASTTKLFTTAIILHLVSLDKISLDDKIATFLDSSVTHRLHVFNGKEYSGEITIKHLMAHTSGIPDYFQNKGINGKSLVDELVHGNDQFWSFEQAVDRSKAMPALFAPGTKNKAHYSDTNYQLLGRIIELVTGKSYKQCCDELIIHPLHLEHTYLYHDELDTIPHTLYYTSDTLKIPKAMVSFGPDGGMVSTSSDMLTFIQAFFKGAFFPIEYVEGLKVWNRIFFPMQSGVGIHLFKLPWFFNPLGTFPDLIGHSGLSGALAYYSPKHNVYIAGTVNQVAHPDLSFRTAIKLIQCVLKS